MANCKICGDQLVTIKERKIKMCKYCLYSNYAVDMDGMPVKKLSKKTNWIF